MECEAASQCITAGEFGKVKQVDDYTSFPGSAWERKSGRLCLPLWAAGGRDDAQGYYGEAEPRDVRSQAEPGNEEDQLMDLTSGSISPVFPEYCPAQS